jgi:hypothetical protein
MLSLFALLFALPCLALCVAHLVGPACPTLPTLDAFQARGLRIARERLHALTGTVDGLIEVRAMARLADEADAKRACDALRAEIAKMRAPTPLPLMVRVRKALGWLHAGSPTLRRLARPWRIARYHARTAVAASVLALALLGSACGVVRALPTRAESRERTASVLGSANATARMVLR